MTMGSTKENVIVVVLVWAINLNTTTYATIVTFNPVDASPTPAPES
tara:strand:- start:6 stop:143 length:138 start_codon:yes stop_codon:yes gene_type:complete